MKKRRSNPSSKPLYPTPRKGLYPFSAVVWILNLIWLPVSAFIHSPIPLILLFAAILTEAIGSSAFSDDRGALHAPSPKKVLDRMVGLSATVAALCMILTALILVIFGGRTFFAENDSYFIKPWIHPETLREISYPTYLVLSAARPLCFVSVLLIFSSLLLIRIRRLTLFFRSNRSLDQSVV
ncbi:MAG: hypothetical protein ACI3XR_09745 [Eubacteriales bacterium]